MLKLVRFSKAELETAGYYGPRMGLPRGSSFGLADEDGIVSLDGKHPYLLRGTEGRRAMESILAHGGFVGTVYRVKSI